MSSKNPETSLGSNELNFQTFVLSLGTATFIALGEVENPVTKKKEENLEAAKQNIRLLEILSEKTAGNLDASESQLLSQVLYETRMKFVSKTGS